MPQKLTHGSADLPQWVAHPGVCVYRWWCAGYQTTRGPAVRLIVTGSFERPRNQRRNRQGKEFLSLGQESAGWGDRGLSPLEQCELMDDWMHDA